MNATGSRRVLSGNGLPRTGDPFPKTSRDYLTNDVNSTVHTVADDIRSCLLGVTPSKVRDGRAS